MMSEIFKDTIFVQVVPSLLPIIVTCCYNIVTPGGSDMTARHCHVTGGGDMTARHCHVTFNYPPKLY